MSERQATLCDDFLQNGLETVTASPHDDQCPICLDEYDVLPDPTKAIDGTDSTECHPPSKAFKITDNNEKPSESVKNEQDKVVRIRSCNHVFHHRCLARWLESRNTCPYCRKKLWSSQHLFQHGEMVFGRYYGWDRSVIYDDVTAQDSAAPVDPAQAGNTSEAYMRFEAFVNSILIHAERAGDM